MIDTKKISEDFTWLGKHKHLWEPHHKIWLDLYFELAREKSREGIWRDEARIKSLEVQEHHALLESAVIIRRLLDAQPAPDPLIINKPLQESTLTNKK